MNKQEAYHLVGGVIFVVLLFGMPALFSHLPVFQTVMAQLYQTDFYNDPYHPTLPTPIIITAGREHTCTLISSGGIKCWGNNGGALGNNSVFPSSIPVDVIGITNIGTAIAGGGYHTCAVLAGGIKCWGDNTNGEIGDGTTSIRMTPVDVMGLSNGGYTVATGEDHSCALMNNSGVKCWGDNKYGQLGDGTTANHSSPGDVVGLSSGITAIATGNFHTCALTNNGGVKCWGSNQFAQLGDGTTTNHNSPGDVVGLSSGVTAIEAGGGHTCVVTNSGGVKCWGLNYYGELGDGTVTDRTSPVNVIGLSTGVTAIAVGRVHTCALTSGGAVKCWGDNTYGQLGDGTTANRSSPVDVVGLSNGATAVVVGADHTCTLMNSGGIKCWGDNSYGQVGDGTIIDRNTPVDVTGLAGLPTPAPTSIPTPAPPPTPSPVPPPTLTISHIEITQAIQDEKNSMPLIAGKPTFIRVYVDCSNSCNSVPNVTGRLEISGPAGQTSILPAPRKLTVYHPDKWTSQRGDLNKTFNYVIPIEQTFGTVILVATTNTVKSDPHTISFLAAKPLNIIYVPVVDSSNPNKLADYIRIKKAFDFAAKIYPTHQLNYTPYLSWDWHRPKRCFKQDSTWNNDCLKTDLKVQLTTLYNQLPVGKYNYIFGWIPFESQIITGGSADPRYPNRTGGAGKAAFGTDIPPQYGNVIDNQKTFAHEVGHLLGRRHTNSVGCEAKIIDIETDWPFTKTHSFIQDYGLDLSNMQSGNNAIKFPDKVYDFMSYCGTVSNGNVWTSPFTYNQIYEQTLKPQAISQAAQLPNNGQSYLIASGLVFTDNTAVFNPSWVITSTLTPDNMPTGTRYCLEALNSTGGTLIGHCFDLFFQDDETGAATSVAGFNLTLPYLADIARLVLRKGNINLAMESVSPNSPSLNIIEPTEGQSWIQNGTYSIKWNANDVDGDSLTYAVHYSSDGTEWLPLRTNVTDTQIRINSSELPGGSKARVRILASDGINTNYAESPAFLVEPKLPQVDIISPENGSTIPTDTPIFLQGYTYDLEDGALQEAALRWNSSKDGDLGVGALTLANLTPGQHSITLVATDSDGNTTSSSINIYIGHRDYMPLVLVNGQPAGNSPATPIAPTATPTLITNELPTATPLPPTATNIPIPPTTNTPIPAIPTNTPQQTITSTPTATSTPIPINTPTSASTPISTCSEFYSSNEIPIPKLINFDDSDDAVIIGTHYQASHGVIFEVSPTNNAIIYNQTLHPTEPTEPYSAPNYVINDAVFPNTSANVPLLIQFATTKTHVGLYMGNGENDASPIVGTLTAYDNTGNIICVTSPNLVPEDVAEFIGIYDSMGRIARVMLNYGNTKVSEVIDNLYFAP